MHLVLVPYPLLSRRIPLYPPYLILPIHLYPMVSIVVLP